jgi:hypothetical protein
MRQLGKKNCGFFVPKVRDLPMPGLPQRLDGFGTFRNARKITPGHPGDSVNRKEKF